MQKRESFVRNFFISLITATSMLIAGPAVAAKKADVSSGKRAQRSGEAQIPVCSRRLGTIAIVEPETKWWSELGLASPEAVIKLFVAKSGCFGLVDRGGGLAARAVERALGDSGELQRGSNIGKRQVKAADYVIVPDIISKNSNSGGGGMFGGIAGALGGRMLGGIVGGLRVSKKEASVSLSLVNVRTTEIQALTEGYARKSDVAFGGGAGGYWGGGLAGVGGSSYGNTEIGQVLVLAYLDGYTKLVTQLGGLPIDPSAAAPRAEGTNDGGARPQSSFAAASANGSGVSRATYNLIRPGMSVGQVNNLVGFEGDEIGTVSNKVQGKIVTYKWEEQAGKFITASFANGKLSTKTPSGL
jgi:curli biogenesis system outer membrane secretion channel CsgG